MVAMPDLLAQCAPQVSPVLMQAVVRTESGGRPWAIGMDRSHGAVKQPESLAEALATVHDLAAAGRKFSVGLAQIHVSNVKLYGMTWEQAFDPCQNLAIGQRILWNFYHRALASGYSGVGAIWAALRGYNSGSVDRAVSNDYAQRILAYMSDPMPGAVVPASPEARRLLRQTAPVKRDGPSPESDEAHDIFAKARTVGF